MKAFLCIIGWASLALPAQAVSAHNAPDSPMGFATQLTQIGAWRFTSRRENADGSPECIEIWRFKADGTGSIESGQQLINKTWRTTVGEDGFTWLRTVAQSSSAGPDCVGQKIDPASFPLDEFSFAVLIEALTETPYMCLWPQMIKQSNEALANLSAEAACFGHIEPIERP